MLEYLKESKDEYAIIALVGKIADLAEKYPFLYVQHVLILQETRLISLILLKLFGRRVYFRENGFNM